MGVLDAWREGIRRIWTSHAAGQQPLRRAAWGVFFWVALTAVLTAFATPEGVDLKAGDTALAEVRAARDGVNRLETERRRRELAALVQPVYDLDPAVGAEVAARIGTIFQQIRVVQADASLKDEQRLAKAKGTVPVDVLDSVWMAVLKTDAPTLGEMELAVRDIVGRVMTQKIMNDGDAAQRRAQVEEETRALTRLAPTYRLFLAELAKPLIRPNVVLNIQETERLRQAAAAQAQPATIAAGQVLVRRGDVVTPQQIEVLRDLGMLRTGGNWRIMAGAALLSLFAVGLIAVYLALHHRDILRSEKRIVLIGLVMIMTLILAEPLRRWSPYLTPIPAAGMLLAVLIDVRLAVLSSLLLAVFAGLAGQVDLHSTAVTVVGSLSGIYSVSRAAQRGDLARAGLVVAAVSSAMIAAIYLLLGSGSWRAALFAVGGGAGAGLLSGVLTIGTLPFLESFFGLLTAIKLLELSNPNQPLLRRLMVEAPGTYHHSLMVANLAEAAAEAVGADRMLTRVGCYYHDIGKMKRPYFFIDNQFGGENPHDKISPHLSALIISSHVKDGIELAKEYKLPQEIINFIPEHHGTNLIGYFYRRATQNADPSETVLESDFRYEGPKPQSRETGIVMLADACEAIVRSMKQPTQETMEAAIRKLIRDRLNDGQLDHTDLTLRDLDTIGTVFIRILTGMYHSRIEYPSDKDLQQTPPQAPARKERSATDAHLGHGRTESGAG